MTITPQARSAACARSTATLSRDWDVGVRVNDERSSAKQPTASEIQIGLLTGGQDRHYALGLAMALVSQGIWLEVVGSDEVDCPEIYSTSRLRFLNLRGSRRNDV